MTRLSLQEITALVSWVRDDRGLHEDGIGCDDAQPDLAAFAEHALRGGPLPPALERVRRHLAECPDCIEEHELLRTALLAVTPPVS